MFVVYKHTNQVNGRAYVGFTPKKLILGLTPDELMLRRWQTHCVSASGNSSLYFHRAIRKHGKDAFNHEVVEVCNTLEEVLQREIFWIAELKTLSDFGGYNMTRGGEGNLMADDVKPKHRLATSEGTRQAWQRPEVRVNHAKAMELVNADPLLRQQRSESQKIAQSTPEARVIKSENAKIAWKVSERLHARRKPIHQIDIKTDEIIATFVSAHDAARQTGITQGNLSKAARGELRWAGGFKWRYVIALQMESDNT